MSYVVKKHQNNLYVVSNKAVGPGKNAKLITVGPTFIPDYRVHMTYMNWLCVCRRITKELKIHCNFSQFVLEAHCWNVEKQNF